jgi:epoxyqueuosine reductase
MEAALKSKILARARELGFDAAGVAPAQPVPHAKFLDDWLARGFAGEMSYMARDTARRKDPRALLARAKSIIVVALNYCGGETAGGGGMEDFKDGQTEKWKNGCEEEWKRGKRTDAKALPPNPPSLQPSTPSGVIARYARGRDYHDLMRGKLDALAAFIREISSGATTKVYVDTGPLLERELAQQAGVGFVGKSTVLINRGLGTWFFLGEILTDLELEPDAPQKNLCGTCARCIEACPTRAIVAPFQLDSRRCISYLTIELKGPIPRDLRPLIGTRIFGCDDCLAVCPWNRFARLAHETAFQPLSIGIGEGTGATLQIPDLLALLSLSEEEFGRVFANSPIKRVKRRGLLRNVCVALGNAGDPCAIPPLIHALQDPEPLVRGHAAWALGRLGRHEALETLTQAGACETDSIVREEISLAVRDCGADWPAAPSAAVNPQSF